MMTAGMAASPSWIRRPTIDQNGYFDVGHDHSAHRAAEFVARPLVEPGEVLLLPLLFGVEFGC